MIRIIIFGTRDYMDYPEFEEKCNYYTEHWGEDVTLLCGKSKGTDTMGEMYAKERGWGIEYYPADWKTHGKAAGPIRNRQMADANPTHAIAFWDGLSRGTKDMILLCKEEHRDIKLRIVYVLHNDNK